MPEQEQEHMDTPTQEMVALRLHEYKDLLLQLAIITSESELDVTIEWWDGEYDTCWQPWMNMSKPIQDIVPCNTIVERGVTLNHNHLLDEETAKDLKQICMDTQFIKLSSGTLFFALF